MLSNVMFEWGERSAEVNNIGEVAMSRFSEFYPGMRVEIPRVSITAGDIEVCC